MIFKTIARIVWYSALVSFALTLLMVIPKAHACETIEVCDAMIDHQNIVNRMQHEQKVIDLMKKQEYNAWRNSTRTREPEREREYLEDFYWSTH